MGQNMTFRNSRSESELRPNGRSHVLVMAGSGQLTGNRYRDTGTKVIYIMRVSILGTSENVSVG